MACTRMHSDLLWEEPDGRLVVYHPAIGAKTLPPPKPSPSLLPTLDARTLPQTHKGASGRVDAPHSEQRGLAILLALRRLEHL